MRRIEYRSVRKRRIDLIGNAHHLDCLDGLGRLPPLSVDFVFADLPYGRTQNGWDKLVPMAPLWTHLRRVCKPKAAIVFTAMQPFTSLVVQSNPAWFRYEVIWRKNKPRGFLNANRQPLRTHENVLVFYREQPDYAPQMTEGHKPVNSYTKHTSDGGNYGATRTGIRGGGSTRRYPTSVLDIPVVNNDSAEHVHSTQKPVDLVAWFIRTYTKPGDVVLDPTIGSGTTLVAAQRLGRRFVGFDIDASMVAHTRRRLGLS